MPAFMAHYTCGVLTQRKLYNNHAEKFTDSPVAKALAAHPNVYHMGLAGPDLFFYSLYEQFQKCLKLGRAIHKYRTDQFLQALYREAAARQGEDREIALAYFAGYLGHYCLDSSTHPYIYRVCHDPDEQRALGKHFRFEAALDVRIADRYLHQSIKQAYRMELIRLSRYEIRVLADIINRAVCVTYPDSPTYISAPRMKLVLLEYRIISGLLLDPTGIKEWIVLSMEKLSRGYSLLSSLCINTHQYGLSEEEFARFDRRFRRACRSLETLLPHLDKLEKRMEEEKTGSSPEQILLWNALFRAVGSRSYHTGRHEDGAITEIDWT